MSLFLLRRCILYFALLVMLFIYARSEGGRFPTFLFIAYTVVLILEGLAFIWFKLTSRLRVTVGQTTCEAYSDFRLPINVESSGIVIGSLKIRLALPQGWNTTEVFFALNPRIGQHGEERQIELTAGHRGRYPIGPFYAHFEDPLGLFRHEVVLNQGTDLWVTPRLLSDQEFSRWIKGQEDLDARFSMLGQPASGARAYQYGDPWQRIHWKATARFQNLMVRESEIPDNRPALLWLDLSRFSYSPDSPYLELAISLAATLLKQLNQRGLPVRFISTGKERLELDLPIEQFDQVLKHLAITQADGAQTADQVLDSLPKSSQLFILTAKVTPQMADHLNQLCEDMDSIAVFLVNPQSDSSGLNPAIEVRCPVSA